MADFDKAVKVVLKNEGKFNDNPHDGGFATNYGISLRFLLLSGLDLNEDNAVDIKDILSLTAFEAKKIYKKEWWDKYRFGEIQNQEIATKIFDLSVNAGCHEIVKLTQQAVNFIGNSDALMNKLKVDGILGSKTINAINYISNKGRGGILLRQIKNNAAAFYSNLVKLNPKLLQFKRGWLRRAEA